jgi:peptide/nickel transport system substrate-binding protein
MAVATTLFLLASAACGPGRAVDRLAIAVESAPLTLDPRGAFNADTAHVQQLVFDTLVAKGPSFDFAPGLAESWAVSPDRTEATFRLRRGVRFHDGRELTARDVAFTFNSLAAGGFGKSSAFAALDRVEAVDALTARFVSKRPNPGLLVDVIAVGVLPEGSGPEAAKRPVGTGPFRVTSDYEGEGDLHLDAFPDYYGGAPSVSGVDVRVIPDAGTRAASVEAGEVDLLVNPGFAPEVYTGLESGSEEARVVDEPGGAVQFVVMNVEKPELADARTRRALALAVDRAAAVRALLGGRAHLATTPLPPGHWAAADLPQVPYDPDGARRLLGESRGGAPTRIERMTLPTAADRDLAAVLAESWLAVGVETSVVPVDRAVFAERLASGDFAAAIHRFTGGNQFTTIFKGAFHSRSIHDRAGTQGELNYARYADPALDALVDAADAEPDIARRAAAYAEVQRRVAEAVPWILLWYPNTIAVAGSRVEPFTPARGGDFTFVRSLSVR